VALLTKLKFPLTAPATVGANCTVTGSDWFGLKDSPGEMPLTVKPAPEIFEEVMVTLALPVFVKVAGKLLVLPTFTLPKLKLETLNVNSSVPATPVPLRPITYGELGASLDSEIEPVTAPAPVGVKTALNVALLPAGIVKGALRPLIWNPVPVTVPCEITRFAVPPFVTVIVWELLFPTVTLPNGAFEGIAAICGCVPVPLNAIVNGEFGALLATETLPLALPTEAGENCAVKLMLCPG